VSTLRQRNVAWWSALVSVLLLAVAGVGFAQPAGVEATLRVGYWGGSIGDAITEVFVDTFREKYGIDVTIVQAFDNPRLTQLLAQGARPDLDVAMFTAPIMPKVVSSGIAARLDPAAIPNLADVHPDLKHEDNLYAAFAFGTWGIVYNTQYIDRPITSWRDLLDPAFRGKVTHPDIAYNSSILSFDALARLDGGSLETDWRPGFENLKRILANSPSFWSSSSQVLEWLKQGEVWISAFASGSAMELAVQPDAPPVRFVNPVEGAYPVPFYLVKVVNARSPRAADLFINHMLDPELQERFMERMFYGPSNLKARVPEEWQGIILSANEFDQLVHLDWAYFEERQDEFTDMWLREIR